MALLELNAASLGKTPQNLPSLAFLEYPLLFSFLKYKAIYSEN